VTEKTFTCEKLVNQENFAQHCILSNKRTQVKDSCLRFCYFCTQCDTIYRKAYCNSITRPVVCVYNPTSIAKLKKQHIPVISYMSTRESRTAVKRKPSPKRTKSWFNDIQECSNSQQSEVVYKPTVIVNSTDQGCYIKLYIPAVKSDSLLSNSNKDSNSNDYRFFKEYYSKFKKKREELWRQSSN